MDYQERTTGLFEELENASMKTGFKDYLKKHPETEEEYSFKQFMDDYVAANPHISTTDIIQKCGLDHDYARQVINGTKHGSRDRIIAICLAAHMDLRNVQRGLKLSNNSILYPKEAKDMAITICINNRCWDVLKVNEYLLENGCEKLVLSKNDK